MVADSLKSPLTGQIIEWVTWVIDWPTGRLTDSRAILITDWPCKWLTHWRAKRKFYHFTDWLTDFLTDWPKYWLTGLIVIEWLTILTDSHWLTYWLTLLVTDKLILPIVWLTNWLIVRLIHSLTQSFIHSAALLTDWSTKRLDRPADWWTDSAKSFWMTHWGYWLTHRQTDCVTG